MVGLAPSWSGAPIAFFRRHPVALLLALTPGIPEYLSGSTRVELLVLSPGAFLLFLLLNLGLYGPGVLLVREAVVRWQKGWQTVLLLGAAYGLLEEGTALSTVFNPQASVVGSLGYYGHFLGVNWVWLVGVLGVHIVLSVGLPLVLLGLALPRLRGEPWLGGRRLPLVVTVYATDITVLGVATHYTVVFPILAALVAGLLWLVAWRLPPHLFDPPSMGPRRSPVVFLLVGLAVAPLLLLAPGLGALAGLPAAATMGIESVIGVGLFLFVRREIGRGANGTQWILLATGVLAPILAIGVLAQIRLPIVLALDAVAGAFLYTLWRHYRAGSARTPVPAGVTGT